MTNTGYVVWFTGLPGAGKTTIAQALKAEIERRGASRVELLDGDELRSTPLAHDLGFSKKDRDENVRRVGFVAELLVRNGVVVLVSLVSPYEAARDDVRARIPRLVLVYVSCSLEELERRDTKGHYAKARRGEIAGFTGVSDPYEPPTHPDVVIDTQRSSIAESVERTLRALEGAGLLGAAVK